MELMRDGVLAFLAAVGLTALVWLVGGLLLRRGRRPVPGLLLVLPVRGEAPTLEADVRELRLLQGKYPGAVIVLADCGLSEETRRLAQYLADREDCAVLRDGRDWNIT